MGISEAKKKLVIDNYFKVECDINTSIKEAFTKGFELGLKKAPQPKTGHWEAYGEYWEDKFKCSECGKEQPKILCGERIIGHWSDYCPNCGAKMESEDKDERV